MLSLHCCRHWKNQWVALRYVGKGKKIDTFLFNEKFLFVQYLLVLFLFQCTWKLIGQQVKIQLWAICCINNPRRLWGKWNNLDFFFSVKLEPTFSFINMYSGEFFFLHFLSAKNVKGGKILSVLNNRIVFMWLLFQSWLFCDVGEMEINTNVWTDLVRPYPVFRMFEQTQCTYCSVVMCWTDSCLNAMWTSVFFILESCSILQYSVDPILLFQKNRNSNLSYHTPFPCFFIFSRLWRFGQIGKITE